METLALSSHQSKSQKVFALLYANLEVETKRRRTLDVSERRWHKRNFKLGNSPEEIGVALPAKTNGS